MNVMERRLQTQQNIPKEEYIRAGERAPDIFDMSYNAKHDELFFTDADNRVVRLISLNNTHGSLREVYRGSEFDSSPLVLSLCYVNESDTLLMCSREQGPNEEVDNIWLVALTRSSSGWSVTQREQHTDGIALQCCAVSESRVLLGDYDFLDLFRVQNGIVRVKHIEVAEFE